MSTTTQAAAPSAYANDSRVVTTTVGVSFPFGAKQYFAHPTPGESVGAVAAEGEYRYAGTSAGLRAVPEVEAWDVVDSDGAAITTMVGDLDTVLQFFLGDPR